MSAVMPETLIAVFLLGLIAGGTLFHLAYKPLIRQAKQSVAYWQKNAAGWEEQSLMRAKLLNAVLTLARDAGALDAATGEDERPRLTVVEK